MSQTPHGHAVRVGSAERSLVADRLVAHYQAGQLPRGELELRLTHVAHAHTDDDLHRLTIDLPDVAAPARLSPVERPVLPARVPASPLRIAFDIAVLLVTFAAFVCLVLLLVGVASTSRSTEVMVALLATVGAFTVGAGGVHLLHRAFGKR